MNLSTLDKNKNDLKLKLGYYSGILQIKIPWEVWVILN